MKVAKIVMYLSLFLSAPGFAFGQARVRESKQLLKLLEAKKGALMGQINNLPYRGDQQAAIKGYFENIEELNDTLSGDWRLAKRFNEVFEGLDLPTSCPKLWLDQETYAQLLKNCTKNRFFLCSEKVRKYENLRENFKKQLTDENRSRFEKTKGCSLQEVQ
ncbi:MAG: hypothetical protein KGQ59_00015 [Bdellovibrionales bacterium]|nr:hypothetical protein [Bdellovibrionales bacterium]